VRDFEAALFTGTGRSFTARFGSNNNNRGAEPGLLLVALPQTQTHRQCRNSANRTPAANHSWQSRPHAGVLLSRE